MRKLLKREETFTSDSYGSSLAKKEKKKKKRYRVMAGSGS